MPVESVLPHLNWHLAKAELNLDNGPKIADLIPEFAERAQTLKDLALAIKPYYSDFERFDEKAQKNI